MKTYTLLRNNFEYGPFTWKDLKAQKLTATDLLWIEGESTAWLSAGDVVGIENLSPVLKPAQPVPASKPLPATADSSNTSQQAAAVYSHNKPATPVIAAYPTLAELEKTNEEPVHWKPRRKRVSLNPQLLNVPILLGGVMLLAYVTKKMVDEFGTEPEVADAQAHELSTENLPPNTAAYTARFTPPITTLAPAEKVTDTASAQLAPVKKTVIALPKKDTATKTAARSLVSTSDIENDVKATPAKTETVETEPAKPLAPPALRLSANDYKVGFLGGVSGVKLTVSNPSSESVENAVIAVDFLKPNGSVVKTETVQAGPISAGGEAVVAVPSSSRGVKISYRVSSIVAGKGSVTANN